MAQSSLLPQELTPHVENLWSRFPELLVALGAPSLQEHYPGLWTYHIKDEPDGKVISIKLHRAHEEQNDAPEFDGCMNAGNHPGQAVGEAWIPVMTQPRGKQIGETPSRAVAARPMNKHQQPRQQPQHNHQYQLLAAASAQVAQDIVTFGDQMLRSSSLTSYGGMATPLGIVATESDTLDREKLAELDAESQCNQRQLPSLAPSDKEVYGSAQDQQRSRRPDPTPGVSALAVRRRLSLPRVDTAHVSGPRHQAERAAHLDRNLGACDFELAFPQVA
mmetsp:Transcript_69266/g.166100  ORF Transcript_69266/g.166100 Transcript_69266/m.166100 type:complete len:276 (+) Transcript_69266:114-941(+)